MNLWKQNNLFKLVGILSGSLFLGLAPLTGRAEITSNTHLISSVPIHVRQEAIAQINPVFPFTSVKKRSHKLIPLKGKLTLN